MAKAAKKVAKKAPAKKAAKVAKRTIQPAAKAPAAEKQPRQPKAGTLEAQPIKKGQYQFHISEGALRSTGLLDSAKLAELGITVTKHAYRYVWLAGPKKAIQAIAAEFKKVAEGEGQPRGARWAAKSALKRLEEEAAEPYTGEEQPAAQAAAPAAEASEPTPAAADEPAARPARKPVPKPGKKAAKKKAR